MAEEVRVSRRRLADGSVMRGSQRKHTYIGQLRGRLENRPCLHATDRFQATVGASLPGEEERRLSTEAVLVGPHQQRAGEVCLPCGQIHTLDRQIGLRE